MSHTVPKLNDPTLFKTGVAYVNGEWVKAASGKTFDVHGMFGTFIKSRCRGGNANLFILQIRRLEN